jgi:hypothetical protein
LVVNRLWKIADLVDLYSFFRLDEEVRAKDGEAALAKRDRTIYLARIEPYLGGEDEVSPRLLIRRWLTARRLHFRQEKGRREQALPGSLWQELTMLSRGLVVLLGVLVGAGAAGSLLLYSGTTPLNVSVYFGLFVLVQLVLVLGQCLLFGYRCLRRLPLDSSTLYLIAGRLLVRGMESIRRWLQRHVSARRRLDLAALMGSMEQQRESAILLFWPAFILVQLGGIGFNLGVLAATISRVIFSDMAFAWQSSLQLSPELVARLVHWVALPWSWLVPQAVPTLAQIQGSQMVLKEGIGHLATADLLAWWPFLCCSVAVYGLLPRITLLVIALIRQHRALEQLQFSSLVFRPLLQRMTAPRLDTNGIAEPVVRPKPEPPPEQPAAVDESTDEAATVIPEVVREGERTRALVLIADELYDDCPLQPLTTLLMQQVPGLRIEPRRYDEGIAASMADAAMGNLGEEPMELFVLLEAWQPPLRETETSLQAVRTRFGPEMPITIVLIGKPSPRTMLTPVDPDQLRIWRQKMLALGDAYLAVQPLIMS